MHVEQKTHIDFAQLVCSKSGDLHNLFLSKSLLQNDNVFGLMIQSGRETMVGRWRGILRRLGDGRDTLEQDYIFMTPSYFSNPVSEFPLTYLSELIDNIRDQGSEGTALN